VNWPTTSSSQLKKERSPQLLPYGTYPHLDLDKKRAEILAEGVCSNWQPSASPTWHENASPHLGQPQSRISQNLDHFVLEALRCALGGTRVMITGVQIGEGRKSTRRSSFTSLWCVKGEAYITSEVRIRPVSSLHRQINIHSADRHKVAVHSSPKLCSNFQRNFAKEAAVRLMA
jgi:hypothetical protein